MGWKFCKSSSFSVLFFLLFFFPPDVCVFPLLSLAKASSAKAQGLGTPRGRNGEANTLNSQRTEYKPGGGSEEEEEEEGLLTTSGFLHRDSWNHQMVWIRKDLEDLLVHPLPRAGTPGYSKPLPAWPCILQGMGHPQHLWATRASASPLSE